jgi:hypothetical protein
LSLDVYRAVVLTVIAVLLGVIAVHMPHNVSLGDLREGRVQLGHIPVVWVQGGAVQADVTGPVDVSGPVEVVVTEDYTK